MMLKYPLISLFIVTHVLAFCQIDDQHVYIPETIQTPKEADMVKGFEGFPSIPFLANNLKGEEVNIFELRGQTIILYFWDSKISNSVKHLKNISKIKSSKGFTVVTFSNDSKDQARETTKDIENRSFHIIANSKTLAEGPYGSELGFPKLFIIDEFGVIKHVLPQSFFDNAELDHNAHIESLIRNL